MSHHLKQLKRKLLKPATPEKILKITVMRTMAGMTRKITVFLKHHSTRHPPITGEEVEMRIPPPPHSQN
jgi:hypothetical protein